MMTWSTGCAVKMIGMPPTKIAHAIQGNYVQPQLAQRRERGLARQFTDRDILNLALYHHATALGLSPAMASALWRSTGHYGALGDNPEPVFVITPGDKETQVCVDPRRPGEELPNHPAMLVIDSKALFDRIRDAMAAHDAMDPGDIA